MGLDTPNSFSVPKILDAIFSTECNETKQAGAGNANDFANQPLAKGQSLTAGGRLAAQGNDTDGEDDADNHRNILNGLAGLDRFVNRSHCINPPFMYDVTVIIYIYNP